METVMVDSKLELSWIQSVFYLRLLRGRQLLYIVGRGWGVVILKHFPFAHPGSLFLSNHHRVLYGHVWRPLAASLKFTATNWLKLNAAGSYRSGLEWAGGRKG